MYDLFRIYPDSELLRLAFVRLDCDIDARISLDEFIKNMAPKDKNYRDLVMSRSTMYNDMTNFPRSTCFSPDTQRAVLGLIKAITSAEE